MSLLTIWCQYGETVNKKTQRFKRSKLIRTEASDIKTGNVTSSSVTTRSRIVESEKESDREGFHSPSTNEAQRKRKKKGGLYFGGVFSLWNGSSPSCGVPVLVQGLEPDSPYGNGTL